MKSFIRGNIFKLICFLSVSYLVFVFHTDSVFAKTGINIPPNYLTLSSGLVGYWTFDGVNITSGTVYDSTGNASNGSFEQGGSSITATSSVVTGVIGQALRFNGSSQYVDLGDPAA